MSTNTTVLSCTSVFHANQQAGSHTQQVLPYAPVRVAGLSGWTTDSRIIHEHTATLLLQPPEISRPQLQGTDWLY